MLYFILKMKLKKILYVLLVFVTILIFYQLFFNYNNHVPVDHLPRLIWWTPFTLREKLEEIQCDEYRCAVTDNHLYFNETLPQTILFYGSNFKPYDLPMRRTKNEIWALVHEESPKNLAFILHEDGLDLFNYSSTFSTFSDFPLTLQYLPSLELIESTKYFVPTIDKNIKLKELAPVLYIQSDCQTPLERDAYVSELMKYIKVDSYGKCLNNKKLAEKFTLNHLENLYEDDFVRFVAQYKFVIAFENAVCDDYITEKLWRPLIAGSVPIYMGSPTIKYWLPNYEKSVILAKNFDTPKALGEYLNRLNKKDYEYENYLQHKLSDVFKITNENLKLQMANRKWDFEGERHFFHEFECFLCRKMHQNKHKYRMETKEYHCPEPLSPLTGKKNNSNWWVEHWLKGKCQAKVLKDIVYSGKHITKDEYDKEVDDLKRKGYC